MEESSQQATWVRHLAFHIASMSAVTLVSIQVVSGPFTLKQTLSPSQPNLGSALTELFSTARIAHAVTVQNSSSMRVLLS
jgi:hypothetical protein